MRAGSGRAGSTAAKGRAKVAACERCGSSEGLGTYGYFVLHQMTEHVGYKTDRITSSISPFFEEVPLCERCVDDYVRHERRRAALLSALVVVAGAWSAFAMGNQQLPEAVVLLNVLALGTLAVAGFRGFHVVSKVIKGRQHIGDCLACSLHKDKALSAGYFAGAPRQGSRRLTRFEAKKMRQG